jgi:acyl carrier protein
MSALDTALDVIAQVSGTAREKLEPEMELVANLGLDSAKALELLVELEERLELEIDDEDAARLDTVGDILEFVRRTVAAA